MTDVLSRWRPRSLRTLLLLLLLPGVLISLAFDSYNDHQTLAHITDEAYDQALRPAIRALENSVYVDASGALAFDPPWYALEEFQAQPEEHIHYRLQLLSADPTEHGNSALNNNQVVAGTPLLPLPNDWSTIAGPAISFYDSTFNREPVRVATQLRELHIDGAPQYLLVQVAQSRANRLRAEAVAWRQELRRDIRAIIVVALLVWLGIRWGLQPLIQLRRDVMTRRANDTTPLDVTAVPTEVVPLVEAVNHHIARHRRMLEQQSQFLADASHQLRTPLTVMLTQAEYAVREPDLAHVRDTLHALIRRLGDTQRMTEQLLSLAQAQHAPMAASEAFDLAACGRSVLIAAYSSAEEREIDLGWDDSCGSSEQVMAFGRRDGIEQAISNLVHNALRYTPKGGTVTVSAGMYNEHAYLSVSDDGPGIPSDLRDQATERFRRLRGSPAGGGSGLGLAIARAFVERDGGSLELRDGLPNKHGGAGLSVIVRLPRQPPEQPRVSA